MSRPPAAWLLAAVLLAAPAHAQEPPPAEQPAERAAAPAAAEQPAAEPAPPTPEELLPILFGDPADPFAGRTTLQARRLRGLSAQVAALVLRGEPGGGIGVAVLAVPLPGESFAAPPPPPGPEAAAGAAAAAGTAAAGAEGAAETGRLLVPALLFVEIDGASFLETNQAEVARVEVYAYALSSSGGVAGHLAEAFAVDAAALGEAVWEGGLRFQGRIAAPPGDYTLRVLVRNAGSGAAGLAEAPLTVPPPGEPAPLALFPTPSDRDAWIMVRSWGEGEGAGPETAPPAYPLLAGGRALRPAALPVLFAGRPAEAALFGAPRTASPRVVLTPAGSAGEGGAHAEAELVAAAGGGAATLRFTTPELAPGEYRLRIAGAGAPTAAPPAVPVLVVAAEAAERALVWTDLRWRVGGPRLAESGSAAAAVLEPPPEEGRGGRGRSGGRRRANRMADAYREALAPLAGEGDRWSAARGALFELQSGALAGDGRGSVPQLQQAVLAVADELAARSPEALPPLIRLHEDLYQDYRRRRVFSLASYNRLMVEVLAELYAERGGSDELAALALVSLGGHLQEANLPATSSRLFRRALTLDPKGRAARLALASLHERYGDPRGAVEQLGPAVAADPGDAEAKLRLAINLARGGGDRRRAEELLGEIAGDGPAWVRSLAHQELARRDLAIGDAAAAAARLEAAVAELPDDRGLRVLLALAYDRLRRPREALDALTGVTPGGGESPRRRYDGWPRGAIEAARERLVDGADERTGELARALGERGRDR